MKNSNFTNRNVKFLRESKNISQAKMSKDLKIDQSTLAKWENGTRQITLEWAIKISDYFNIFIGDFISKDFITNTKAKTPSSDKEYKQILREKGLMDDNDFINKENLDKLMKIADIIESLDKKKEN